MSNKKPSLKIIINADDLGENKKVNKAINEYARKGLITSASILANGEEFEEGCAIASTCQHISIGVHLNLSQFKSLSAQDIFTERSITNSNHIFTGLAKYNNRHQFEFDKFLADAVLLEWRLQIEKIFDNNIPISHIDGHNHVHYHNKLFPVIKKLQKLFKIDKVRIKDVKPLSFYGIFNKSLPKKTPPLRVEFSNFIWNQKIKNIKPLTKTVDHVFSYLSLFNYLSTGSKCPQKGIFELVVHPGSQYLEYFLRENAIVEQQMIFKFLPSHELITYNDLS